jgi:hypothetical protein
MTGQYKAEESKFLWFLLAIMMMTYAYALESVWMYGAYLLLSVCLVLALVDYRLIIEEGIITFEVRFLGMTLRRRRLQANDIDDMHIIKVAKRVIVLVNVKSGFRLKLHRFRPTTFYEDLQAFAIEHHIKVKVTDKNR